MLKLTEILKSKNLKVTPQRLAIYKLLYNTTSHPSAEIIYNQLQTTHPTMSLATVYKTLDTLKKSNLIQELNVGEDSFRYDANVKDHPHAICLTCNRVIDLEINILDEIKDKIERTCDFDVLGEKLYIYGYCPECKEQH